MSEKTLKLTVTEGQNLFAVSLGFSLPEKIGERKYGLQERSLADRQVGKLFVILRSMSPLYTGPKKSVIFGPEDAWE